MQDKRTLILKGWPSIRDYVRLRKSMAAEESAVTDTQLTQEWRRAHALVQQRAPFETTSNSRPDTSPLPQEIRAEAATELDSPLAEACFGLVPRSWAWIDLRQLIVWQRYVHLGFAARLKATLPQHAGPHALLQFALGHNREEPKVLVKSQNGNRFTFTSSSSDLRVLDTLTLRPSQVTALDVRGRPAAIVAVAVGYSFNAMIAVQMNNRLILLNGTHRAYTLLAAGITHAPCIIRHLNSAHDVELVSPPPVGAQTLSGLLADTRPPCIEDFFDEQLTSTIDSNQDGHILDLELTFTRSAFRLA